jgi:hypothetical protein
MSETTLGTYTSIRGNSNIGVKNQDMEEGVNQIYLLLN